MEATVQYIGKYGSVFFPTVAVRSRIPCFCSSDTSAALFVHTIVPLIVSDADCFGAILIKILAYIGDWYRTQ